ncbi:neutral/alkaline non-lysosomal ceramidase N-terminal domain-containing protein [Corynebacterium sphenisci]|uniref:neutral/alkaline non-lysosomal ceramidase N-terminal domain-containing protein n=1 Tax=Corynebacterium sphenisci TaxID=191493 RepID=UPI0026DF770F|nr:neutral/alkaline non-lysosomal ceramidase N-terminal domain-containing protein [Corynebacterium sphenisci]MDO5731291.1 neutral/alkaline non-lysosomal ceramidase N-terminal domain-containing protein [Corynebacterium sphenisci]
MAERDAAHGDRARARSSTRRAFLGGSAAAAGALLLSRMTAGAAADAARARPMRVGRGLADMTGEPLGAGMNGYAVPEQASSGLHQRQFARAFVFADAADRRLVHVTADMGLMFQSIQQEVLRRLAARYGALYHEGNVLIGASHTHVAPGGTSGHLLVDITTMGFRPVTFEATVAGIVSAIERAHADLAPGAIALTVGTVGDAGVNRSRAAFERNPAAERALFPGGVNPDSTTLHVLRGGRSAGFINWFGIHPTTFGPEHTLISGDSKGYAAWLTEHAAGVDHRAPAEAPFVAAFAMSTPGDVSPNQGLVPGSGPGVDEYDSARILGRRQADGVRGRAIPLAGGGIEGRHRWVDMSDVAVAPRFTDHGRPGRTGPAILGAAFAASSQEDGGGDPALGFNEGSRGGTPWVRRVNAVAVPPAAKEIHGAKELLLPVGYLPGMVQQTHLFHLHRLAGLLIASLPFEPTTVAGHRIRRTVAAAAGVDPALVIVQGYVSGYGHYVATPEEYDQQDYEGGATVFGRDTLPAVLQIFDGLAADLAAGRPGDPGRPEGDLTALIPPSPAGGPPVDLPPAGRDFGDVLAAPGAPVRRGEPVTVEFAAANPNADLRHEAGYHVVEDPSGAVVADDSHEDTRLLFRREGARTVAVVRWDTAHAAPGVHRIRYRASARDAAGRLRPFTGAAEVELL